MILVDTSVLIGFLKGQHDEKSRLFEEVLKRNIPFGISAYTYQEVLQGARDEKEYEQLRSYLSTQTIYYLPEKEAAYEQAARLYDELRRSGVTPRGTVDMLIVVTAIVKKLLLLHNDRDFDVMAEKISKLKIFRSF